MRLLRHWMSFVSPWLLFGTCIAVVVLVQQFQLSSRLSSFHQVFNAMQLRIWTPTNITPSGAATGGSSDYERPLPGHYNLLEDTHFWNGALVRPTKECTLGNKFVKRYVIDVTWRHLDRQYISWVEPKGTQLLLNVALQVKIQSTINNLCTFRKKSSLGY